MKRFLFRDDLNKQKETLSYDATDFVWQFSGTSANKPVLTGATGLIDSSLIPSQAVAEAALLSITKKAQVNIAAGDCVYAVSDTHVGLATFNDSQAKATVFGVASTTVLAGADVKVTVIGIVFNSAFNVFPVNKPLFLDEDGGLSDDRPTEHYLTAVGKSLGNGYVMIQLSYPTKLT